MGEMRPLLSLLILLLGCQFSPPDIELGTEPLPACEDWTPAPTHVDPCVLGQSLGSLVLETPGEYVYKSDTGELDGPGTPTAPASQLIDGLRVVSVHRLRVGPDATLRIEGSRPVVVAAWFDISVAGTIDVGSSQGSAGAGADPDACAGSAPTPGENDTQGGGGGGGGAFGGDGGDGGNGDDGDGQGGNAGMMVAASDVIRGGCAGADGGLGDAGSSGPAGPGGGAIQLTARVSIDITGEVSAGGGGGAGGSDDAGGGGGGSGGLVDLEAPTITLGSEGRLGANGGGGGEGGSDGTIGRFGDDGNAETKADGGSGMGRGGGGGDGSFETNRNGLQGSSDGQGGGGGGGGCGFIHVHGMLDMTPGAVVSPDPLTM